MLEVQENNCKNACMLQVNDPYQRLRTHTGMQVAFSGTSFTQLAG